jgi:phosphoribosylglycinamide formyltransferase
MADGESSSKSTRITVLISGSGTNLQALIDACYTPSLPKARIVRVISDRKAAYGLERAAKAGIPTTVHGILPYRKEHPGDSEGERGAYDAKLAELVLADEPEIVVCAGFMRILTTAFLEPVKAKLPVINLHPSLYGDLVGAHCIERAWEEFKAGKRTKTGIMIHYVITEVDKGEPIVQEEISIEGCKELSELQEQIHEHEHGLIVKGTKIAIERLKGEKKA